MADTKKEHFVPRCYLVNFENNNKRIHVFDKKILKIRCQKKEEIAHENYFYDIDYDKIISSVSSEKLGKIQEDIKEITGIDDWNTIKSTVLNPKHIEKDFLCKIESEYAHLLKHIIEKNNNRNQWELKHCFPITEDERNHLAIFISIQFLRSKAFRDIVTQTYEKTIQTLLYKMQMNNDNALNKASFKVQSNEDYIKLQHIDMLLDEEMVCHIAETLLKHIWVMYVNKTDTPFYTSDNPIITIPHKNDKYMSYGGLSSEGVEIAFPISPNLLIAMYETTWHSSSHKNLSFEIIKHTSQVDYYNINQLVHSSRCIFSNINNFNSAMNFCMKHPLIRDSNNRIDVE